MIADAYDAVSQVPGITHAVVTLADHHAPAEINGGVAAQSGFVASFEGEATDEPDELREQFLQKAAMAGQDRVAQPLVDEGAGPDDLAVMTLGQVPPSGDLVRLRERRAKLGLAADDDAPLLLHKDGSRVTSAQVPLHLRRVRLTRMSIETKRRVLQEPAPDAVRGHRALTAGSAMPRPRNDRGRGIVADRTPRGGRPP